MKTESSGMKDNHRVLGAKLISVFSVPSVANAFFLSLVLVGACRGQVSEEPPVHLQRNMQSQRRFDPMEENSNFRDNRAMRPIPAGAVARVTLKDDDTFFRGGEPLTMHYGADAPKGYDTPSAKPAGVTYTARGPLEVTPELLHQGERRYSSYCTPCHGSVGDGKGMVAARGFVGIADLHQDRIVKMPDGEIFSTITNGLRNMPSYASQIDEADRWAIIAYVRALQISQNAQMADIPEDKRSMFAQKAETQPSSKSAASVPSKSAPSVPSKSAPSVQPKSVTPKNEKSK